MWWTGVEFARQYVAEGRIGRIRQPCSRLAVVVGSSLLSLVALSGGKEKLFKLQSSSHHSNATVRYWLYDCDWSIGLAEDRLGRV